MADGHTAIGFESYSAPYNERIEAVDYTFYVVDGLDPDLRVRRFQWTEGLSMPYTIDVELVTQDLDADLEALLGASVELSMERTEQLHSGYGIVERVETLGMIDGELSLRLRVVPALRLLKQREDTRIFQGQTVPEILDEVLSMALAEYGRAIEVKEKLSAQYTRRDCCVQFRESDLEFCSRLMEEEGIAYYFEPDDDAQCERMVLVDDNANYGEVELLVGDEVPIIPDRQEQADRESLRSFDLVLRERVNRVVTRGYNWKVPGALDEGEQQTPECPRQRTRELFILDEQRQIVDDPVDDPGAEWFTGEQHDQRRSMARRHLERATVGARVGRGRSNVVGFAPGLIFTLGEHPRDDLDQVQFLITHVVHEGEAPEVERGGNRDGEASRYANHIECIPFDQPFRPAQATPKPRVHGAQTATVMGSTESPIDDIHTDRHGRIKLRFHWDRRSPHDQRASCWVRVAQPWAGSGWGTLFIPRVGMEVVVDFLDGNPDRPLVIGCVYNGTNEPPYTLPDEKTKSTIKSSSTPGGGGFNELRFEDAKGREEIFLHAQRRLCQVVRGSSSRTVGGDESISIGGSQSVVINGRESKAEEQPGRHTRIDGRDHLETTGSIRLDSPEEIVLAVGETAIRIGPKQVELRVADGAWLTLSAGIVATSKDSNSSLTIAEGVYGATTADMALKGSRVEVRGETEVQVGAPTIRLN